MAVLIRLTLVAKPTETFGEFLKTSMRYLCSCCVYSFDLNQGREYNSGTLLPNLEMWSELLPM